MSDCKHESLDFIGQQKTEDGANSYYKCKTCGTLLVMMPSRQVIGIPVPHDDDPPSSITG